MTQRKNPDATTSQRDFNDEDLRVLNTIRVRKTRTNTWSDVAKMLAAGEREEELPPSALLMSTISPVEQMQALMTARKDLEIAEARIADLEARLFKSEQDRDVERERIAELREQIAVLKYRLEQANNDE